MAERQGQLDEAESRYAKLVEKDPTLQNVWFRLGYLQLQRGNNADSIAAFEACLAKQSDWAEAEINLSMAHSNAGHYEQADAILRRLLSRHPDSVEALKGLAAIALKREDRESALEYHRRLIDAGVVTPEVFYNAGLLSQQLNNPQNAVRFYELALEAYPNFAEARLNLGHALESMGKKQEARASWVRALDLKPELARVTSAELHSNAIRPGAQRKHRL